MGQGDELNTSLTCLKEFEGNTRPITRLGRKELFLSAYIPNLGQRLCQRIKYLKELRD